MNTLTRILIVLTESDNRPYVCLDFWVKGHF